MLCTECQRDLTEDAFPMRRNSRNGKRYRSHQCRDCVNAKQRAWHEKRRGANLDVKRCRKYDYSDLRYRPIEHIMETLGCRTIGKALGIDRNTAAKLMRDPSAYVDTPLELDDEKVQRIRAWLESAA